jgi:Flp pilus assembly protein TadG
MLRRLARLARHDGGVAMVEFAIVLPVLLVMFIGSFVVSDMISCYRKVTIATRAMTDLVSRNVSPTGGVSTSTITTYMTGSQLVLSPFSAANATMQITLLRVCDATHAYVVWTQAQTGSAAATPALTAGTVVTIPANLITSPMVPTSPDGTDVCYNTAASTATKTQVGTAGGYLFYGQVAYAYTPVVRYGATATTVMGDQIYMSPRLN